MSSNSKFITALLVFLFAFTLKGTAQDYEVINLETLLNSKQRAQKVSSQKSSLNKKNTGNSLNIEKIETLVFDVSPTIYIQDNNVHQFENTTPIMASIEDDSYRIIYTENDLFQNIEMVKLRYNKNSNINIDVSKMNSFSSLKYFFIQCESSCTEKELANIFTNAKGISILYQVIQSE
ncbi:hypothetical protein [uncultured Christiangramia sp.]|uniref:hypothetical protein n=1 Tax=uncultured Christiangramia sp. TaxID=503836 RepID=UPI0025CC4871|nr:hypothetical protein [uncultured Christiangramia sp.]|tara:strand:+ start:2118 stop:2651 length:534 start_codon:yes stop_codon:yes gene_type:complete